MGNLDWLIAFGASDPEAEAAKRLLDSLRIEWVQVTMGGRPVDGRSAYQCDPIPGVTHWFECNPLGAPSDSSSQDRPCAMCGSWPTDAPTDGLCGDEHPWGVVIDHHRPGDWGFGRPAEEFLAGSSIGQLITQIAYHWVDFPHWPEVQIVRGMLSGVAYQHDIGYIACVEGGPTRVIPQEILMVAAADHCLAAAYRGECPGIDPEDLMKWRAASRAAYQQRDVADVLRDIKAAEAAIHAAPRITLRNTELVDLRGLHVPELPEAQARLGVSVLCDGLPDRDGRSKVNVMGDPRACRAFLDSLDMLGCDPTSGYGDPSRGIVGAYRTVATSRLGAAEEE